MRDIKLIETGIYQFSLPRGILNIDKTFDCGQCFRWVKLRDGSYRGVVGNNLIYIRQLEPINNSDIFQTNFNILESDNLRFLEDYLGLNIDYTPLYNIELTEYEKKAIQYGLGIRILHQDLWETIVSFIISQRNNIPKIKSTINNLCRLAGTKLKCNVGLGRFQEYYTFPTPDQIESIGIQGLLDCGLGYRAEYVYNIALEYKEKVNNFYYFNKLGISSNQVIDYLIQFKGIGPKVANCIALFSYNKLDSFPIDVWISRIIQTEYNGNIDISRFGSLAGLMQQYIFYYTKYKESLT